MQLELLNEQGQAASKVDAPETVFGRDYNEALIHQLVVVRPMPARARGSEGPRAGQALDQEARSARRVRANARAGMTSSPLWRGGGRTFPNSPDETSARRSTRRCTAPAWRPSLAAGARDGRLAVVEPMKVDSPKTKQLASRSSRP